VGDCLAHRLVTLVPGVAHVLVRGALRQPDAAIRSDASALFWHPSSFVLGDPYATATGCARDAQRNLSLR
jgi:hypothetical protein